ncbi:hypothetical protein [Mycobacterium sp.]|uniref:hypothetical protein n=1 Tax=Mycobacterium sp. TaxID=1785 RepID=UPI003A5BC136
MAMMAGQGLAARFALTGEDTCYVSMPLFHSNAVVAEWGHKTIKRQLIGQGAAAADGIPWAREARGSIYRPA